MDWTSGTTRALPPLPFQGNYMARWHPNGRSVVVWGSDKAGERPRYGYYRVDIETNETTPIVLFPQQFPPVPGHFECSADGRALLYVDQRRGIVAHDFQSHQESVVVANGTRGGIGRFAQSRADQSIVFLVEDDQGRGTAIELQSADGRQSEVVHAVPPESLDLDALTPDGSSLIFARLSRATRQLWLVPLTGGPARDLYFRARTPPNPVNLSPDGRWIAFSEWTHRSELRIVPLGLGLPAPRPH